MLSCALCCVCEDRSTTSVECSAERLWLDGGIRRGATIADGDLRSPSPQALLRGFRCSVLLWLTRLCLCRSMLVNTAREVRLLLLLRTMVARVSVVVPWRPIRRIASARVLAWWLLRFGWGCCLLLPQAPPNDASLSAPHGVALPGSKFFGRR